MERTYINEVQKEIGSTVKVQGFIENLRNSKYMAFIVLKDITGKLQITVEKADHPDLVDTIDKLTPDSVITVTGKVMENDYVKMGGIEMIPESIEIESIADPLPIVRKEIAATKKKKAVERSSIDQRIDYRWIDLRTDENQLMFKAQSCFVNAMRQFLLERNFIEIHTPKLIAAASESGSEVFKVDYFDRNAYLAQSPQFYKQMAMAAGFERIFETGPVFRAEKSYTNKHSTEFSGFDLKFSYITSFKDVMKMEEELLTAGLKAVKENYGDQIKELFGQEVIVPTTPFPVVKLADLYKGLEEEFGYTVDESEKGDLTTEAERLSSLLRRSGIRLGEDEMVELNVAGEDPAIRISDTLTYQHYVTVETDYKILRSPDPLMDKGTEEIIRKGIPGQIVETYEDTVVSGEVVSTKYIGASHDTSHAELVRYGTRVYEVDEGDTIEKDFPNEVGEGGYLLFASGDTMTYNKVMLCSSTAYYSGGDGGAAWTTAVGAAVGVGTVAVDPKVIPYYTKMFIQTTNGRRVYGMGTALDCGGAVKGNIVDLWFPTKADCYSWGRRNVTVYILDKKAS